MINFNNHNIKYMSYNGHMIRKAYGCDARLVWQSTPRTYFRFKALDSGTFTMSKKMQYSIDGGQTWSILEANTPSPTIQDGNYIWWKNNAGGGDIGTFSSTGRFEAEGNIMSLVVADDFADDGKYYGGVNFRKLFGGCTGLTSAERIILPNETKLGRYGWMFDGCTNLKSAPELPATTLASYCYCYMFNGCTSLTKAPSVLPAKSLARTCYSNMFMNCTSLKTAPDILATSDATESCSYMFQNCTSLTKAPSALYPTSLASFSYANMFQNCTSLTKSPIIYAETFADFSCFYMFIKCSKLNEITCLATNTGATSATTSWVKDVAATGTFYKNKNMTNWTIGDNGIPTGWVVKDYEPEIKFLATYSDGSTASAECDSSSAITSNEINKTNLISVEIGDCVTKINKRALAECSSITGITIGTGIKTIETYAFSQCSNLASLTLYATVPPTTTSYMIFSSVNCQIYVPASSVNSYKSASGWSSLSSRIFPIQ